MAKKDKPYEDPETRRKTAAVYREQRTRELKGLAEKAVGSPVELAARFGTVPAGSFATSIPLLGQLLALSKTAGVPKPLRGLRMLALDDEKLYAIGARGRGADDGVLVTWPRATARVASIAKAGTDSAVTFEASAEVTDAPSAFRLYCSSLPTNPWASAVVRALGGNPPPPIDPTELRYDPVDLPTV